MKNVQCPVWCCVAIILHFVQAGAEAETVASRVPPAQSPVPTILVPTKVSFVPSDENDRVTGVARSLDGKHLVAATMQGKVWLCNLANEKVTQLAVHPAQSHTNRATISHDGRLVASNCSGNGLTIWDASSHKMLRTIRVNGAETICFSPNGKIVAAAGSCRDDAILIYDVESGDKVADLRGHDDRIMGLSFSPDGKALASGGMDKSIRVWNVESSKQTAKLLSSDPKNCGITSVAFSPDGKLIASTGASPNLVLSDPLIRLWDVEKGTELDAIIGGPVMRSVCFSPDGRLLLSIEFGTKVRLWQISDRREVAAYDASENNDAPDLEVALFLNRSILVVGGSVRGANNDPQSKLVFLKLF